MSQANLPIHYAKLIIKYTHRMLSDEEGDELDEWICASDENLAIYEELLGEVTDGLIDADKLIDDTDRMLEIWMIAALIEKERQHIIEPEEKRFLTEWAEADEENKSLYAIMANPAKHQKIVVLIEQLMKGGQLRPDLN